MEKIKAFKGIRFNLKNTAIQKCIAPPYDVFNYGDTVDKKLRQYPYNIVHIQKPLGPGDSKYENADKIAQKFISNKILIKEKKEGVYILKQTWGKSFRTGIIAAVLLDDTYTRIKPHEKTKPGPIEDRLKLTKSTGLNIGSIFVVLHDNNNTISNLIKEEISILKSLYSFEFPASIQNELYFTQNPEIPFQIENKTLYIADGHHRYQTMLDFRNYMRGKQKPAYTANKFEYTMMFIAPHSEITILPYHRLIKNIETELIDSLMDSLKHKFRIKNTAGEITMPQKGSIGICYKNEYYILTPDKKNDIFTVELLHQQILEPYLGLTDEKIKSGNFVHYIPGEKDIPEILKPVITGQYQAGFILNPPEFKDIQNVSMAGKTMPRKSTYFYPKVPSGIVMYEAV